MELGFPSVEAAWRAALFFDAKGPSAGLQFLREPDRVALDALKAQARDGPAGDAEREAPGFEDSARQARRAAWLRLGGMAREQAKEEYVRLLHRHVPGWPDWYREHAQDHQRLVERQLAEAGGRDPAEWPQSNGQGGEDQGAGRGERKETDSKAASADDGLAGQLLREFQAETGLRLNSRL